MSDEGEKVEQALIKARNAINAMRAVASLGKITDRGRLSFKQNGSELDKQLSKAKRSLSRYRAQMQRKGLL